MDEFKKTLKLSGFAPSDPILALAQLGVARAYAAEAGYAVGSASSFASMPGSGSKAAAGTANPEALASARAAYQALLDLWKNADADLPILPSVRAEYARLSSS